MPQKVKENRLKIGLLALLMAWFGLVLIGVPGLVGAPEQAEYALYLLWMLPMIAALFGYVRGHKYADWLLLVFFLIWGYLQYDSHWRWVLTGASARQIAGYYRTFSGYWRIIPASDTMIYPDGFHMVLHALIVVNLGAVLTRLICRLKKK